MIVWIINGKTKSVREALEYISDESKTAKNFDESRIEQEFFPEVNESTTYEEFFYSSTTGINRALKYVWNDNKIGGYISGYLCEPTTAEMAFKITKNINLRRVGKTIEEDDGHYFYHIIQSFPEDLDISDDEVHQCGIELVERLGLYQAVIASHIHPTIDEKEHRVRGKCKHNHIILNSHIYHKFVDPTNPHKMKYNNCTKTYEELRCINDQIAIEHGLPIIMNPDKDRSRSWYESNAISEGNSWKQRIRSDISGAMKNASDLDSYLEIMGAIGYQFRQGYSQKYGAYIVYTRLDGKETVRDFRLGQGYTVAELNAYWELQRKINEGFTEEQPAAENRIGALLNTTSEPLFIKLVLKMSQRRKRERIRQNLNIKSSYTHYFPLSAETKTKGNAELTYFDALKTYEIVNQQHQTMMEVEGAELLAYFNRLRKIEMEKEKKQQEENKKKQTQEYYCRPDFWDSRHNRPYRVGMYDKFGRKRTIIELLAMLAIVVIKNECDKWMANSDPSFSQVVQRHPIYAKRDWKIQNMVDIISLANAENVRTLGNVEEKLNSVGKDLAKARAEHGRLTTAKNRMDILNDAILVYKEVKLICEEIYSMPDGPEKAKMQEKYAGEIKEYKESKSVMYRHEVSSESDIADFIVRHQNICEKIPVAEAYMKEKKEEYRRLCKLRYNIQLAQNKNYCFGRQTEYSYEVENHDR